MRLQTSFASRVGVIAVFIALLADSTLAQLMPGTTLQPNPDAVPFFFPPDETRSPEPLFTRIFHLPQPAKPESDLAELKNAPATFLSAFGLDIPDHRVYYNDRTQTLHVRGTEQELAEIEAALAFTSQAPATVRLDVKLAELPEEVFQKITPQLQAAEAVPALRRRLAQAIGRGADSPLPSSAILSILTAPAAEDMMEQLAAAEGVDILRLAPATTASGRQVRIAAPPPEEPVLIPPFYPPGKYPLSIP